MVIFAAKDVSSVLVRYLNYALLTARFLYQNVVSTIVKRGRSLRWILLFASLFVTAAFAQPVLRVSSLVWQELSIEEKTTIQQRYIVETVDAEALGVIIDNQAADRSAPGSNAGTHLGAVIGGTAYLDRAFRNGNYSPGVELGAIILGGVIGSTLNTQPRQAYQFRYAVRTLSGNITYHDTFSSEPFRHPVGVCVFLPLVSIVPEQKLCTQTVSSFREAYMPSAAGTISNSSSTIGISEKTVPETVAAGAGEANSYTNEVSCRLGLMAPVKTSPAKCRAVNGVILND